MARCLTMNIDPSVGQTSMQSSGNPPPHSPYSPHSRMLFRPVCRSSTDLAHKDKLRRKAKSSLTKFASSPGPGTLNQDVDMVDVIETTTAKTAAAEIAALEFEQFEEIELIAELLVAQIQNHAPGSPTRASRLRASSTDGLSFCSRTADLAVLLSEMLPTFPTFPMSPSQQRSPAATASATAKTKTSTTATPATATTTNLQQSLQSLGFSFQSALVSICCSEFDHLVDAVILEGSMAITMDAVETLGRRSRKDENVDQIHSDSPNSKLHLEGQFLLLLRFVGCLFCRKLMPSVIIMEVIRKLLCKLDELIEPTLGLSLSEATSSRCFSQESRDSATAHATADGVQHTLATTARVGPNTIQNHDGTSPCQEQKRIPRVVLLSGREAPLQPRTDESVASLAGRLARERCLPSEAFRFLNSDGLEIPRQTTVSDLGGETLQLVIMRQDANGITSFLAEATCLLMQICDKAVLAEMGGKEFLRDCRSHLEAASKFLQKDERKTSTQQIQFQLSDLFERWDGWLA
eukprot:TRINITY_DN19103_c0_g1_i1.p1 TRINITY_DN19103_c0_g1~~TRINITY_DN19103_c0_g1_i1.p1  ORF type:complete len:520 (+),score=84.65 TRINITY_DN19103_c0_g1_i1:33-1592(+)